MVCAGIYAIVNTVNGHMYVGSSVNLMKRQKTHWSVLRRGKHWNQRLQAAWNKYGPSVFVFRIVTIMGRTSTKEELSAALWKREEAFLPFGEYNLSVTAPGHRLWTPAQRQAQRERYLGKPLSPERRDKVVRALFGRRRSEESRNKTRMALLGRKRPPDVIEKVAAAMRGKPWSKARRDAQIRLKEKAS